MSRELLLALIGGISSAILSIGSFGPAPIIAVGLSLGWTLASISAAIAALILLFMIGGIGVVEFIAITAVPALIIVRLGLKSQPGRNSQETEWYPPGMILGWLTAYGLGLLALITLYFAIVGPGIEASSQDFMRTALEQLIEQSGIKSRPGIDASKLAALPDIYARLMGPILPGLALSGSLLFLMPNATIAQGILARTGHALRPTPAYAAMILPRWISGALAVAVAATFLPGAIGGFAANAAIILSTPFFLLGLTVIHTLSRRASKPGSVLAAIYIALFLLGLLMGLAVLLIGGIVLLGIAEQWISLRQRFAAGGANQEDE